MAGYSVINYKGKEISYIDYRGMKLEQILQTIDEAVNDTLNANKSRALLTNISGAFLVPEFMEKSKEGTKKTRHLTLKSAVVGITGAKKILLNSYNMFTKANMKAFDNEESAKEWLISD